MGTCTALPLPPACDTEARVYHTCDTLLPNTLYPSGRVRLRYSQLEPQPHHGSISHAAQSILRTRPGNVTMPQRG